MLITLLSLGFQTPRELDQYLRAPDAAYRYQVEKASGATTTISMVSQTWHGFDWKHQILYTVPKSPHRKGVAILYITGDGPRPGDYADIALMSQSTGMPIAMLFDEPNQPLWGLKEDDLIAYTFNQYLQTADATWPLLFPMTKAALRAMDAVQSVSKSTDNPVSSFVVTGASKRGWTTWMTAATGDKRVIGVAPMVYDNLNILAQMPHQLASWGAYSEMIEAYTKLGLQSQLSSDKGRELGRMVDPYSYRSRFRVPILVVKGSNDPYWAADAADEYFKDLRPLHWMFTVPNAGHTLNGGFLAAQSIGAFARSVAGDFPMPDMGISQMIEASGGSRKVTVTFKRPTSAFRMKPWVATSDTTDFRKSKYTVADLLTSTANSISFAIPGHANVAFFVESDFKTPDGHEYGLSTPTKVVGKG